MISNLGETLDEMKRRAEERGRIEGEKRGEIKRDKEIIQYALNKGFTIEEIIKFTGLERETILKYKEELDKG